MTQQSSLEESLRQLERHTERLLQRVRSLASENTALRDQLARLKDERGQIRARLDVVLDRIDGLS
jgi:predicted nuclease with TOPRIM domain